MDMRERQRQSAINVQEKAKLIWDIATHLYGEYKPHEYGKVILPMTVIKRFHDALIDTKEAVLARVAELDALASPIVGPAREGALEKTANHLFYNTSRFDFKSLLADPENIKENFISYLHSFSENVQDIIQHFKFFDEIDRMSQNNLLYTIISEFNTKKANFSPSTVSSQDMGYVFEELIRKFSESYNEQAGTHFTSRDIIYLMTELLIIDDHDRLQTKADGKTVYDMAMGTSQMLGCFEERLHDINPSIAVKCFGQEINPETFAIAKADMLIKGGSAENMKFGDTLSDDQFGGYSFDFIISNPPFGIDWKKERDVVISEHQRGDGRFDPGLPSIGDSQMLFLLNGIRKLKATGRMTIIQNGSSLFNGDAGSGPSNIRRYILENDLLEAIVQLPNDLFYNTGIATYIWVITKTKQAARIGQVQLIDASKCFEPLRKNIGSKRVELTENCLRLIIKAYKANENGICQDGSLSVESKIFANEDFGYRKIEVLTPLLDDAGQPVMKKGKPVIDKSRKDSETIPLTMDIEEYFKKEVQPYDPHAWFDVESTKVGYEIPFVRYFYKYQKPIPATELKQQIEELEAVIEGEMKVLFQ